jgi:hypothetical protein
LRGATMKRFRIRDRWRRITPLSSYPMMLRAAVAVFLHHSVTEMPPDYQAKVALMKSTERARQTARERRADRSERRRLRRAAKVALRAVLDAERAHMRDKLETIAVARGFLGISYSIAVFDHSGHVWKARGWRRVGAHTLGWNDRAVAIVAVGNYSVKKPSKALEEGIARTLVKGRRRGRIVADYAFRPHSDVKATECPGSHLRPRMPAIKARAERIAA